LCRGHRTGSLLNDCGLVGNRSVGTVECLGILVGTGLQLGGCLHEHGIVGDRLPGLLRFGCRLGHGLGSVLFRGQLLLSLGQILGRFGVDLLSAGQGGPGAF
jgi:hypothetical protein